MQTVNARELHAFLEVGKDFSNWIKDRIQRHGFLENQDVVCIEGLSSPNLASSKSRPQRTREYHLTIDAAKHISMAEHTPKGQEARQYFIECEKRLYKLSATPQNPNSGAVERLRLPNLLHGFPKGTTLKRITVMERKLVGQGVQDFGLEPEAARSRALEIMRESLGIDPAFLFRGLPIVVPGKPKKKVMAIAPKVVDALSVDRTARSANDPSAQQQNLESSEPVFCGAQELAGKIPVTCSTGQPDGHLVNEALVTMGYAFRRSDNSAYPRQPQADGLFRLEQVTTPDGRKIAGRYFTIWDAERILPILRQHFNEKPKQLQLVTS
ncbi:MAG: antA/AntB antirepressor family protein [Acidithiobacillus sp.]